MMIFLTLAATAASIAFLLLIAVGDPKRRRAAGLKEGDGRSKRSLYVLAAILPGLLVALSGDAAMWLVWFGVCALAGWVIALWFAKSAIAKSRT